ncbi:MAG: YchJ family protein [Gammaproteobacteria bacterium]|nr:YchJ family protein [Gammaproteobacteria bacterium]
MSNASCPCGSGKPLNACCGVYHAGVPAPTPEALMRSRYSAFALHREAYLAATWHASTCPARPILDPSAEQTGWVRLQILSSAASGDDGNVHFKAYFYENAQWFCLEEASEFVREEGRWFYLRGQPRVLRLDVGRNDPCPCGSGQKLKKCAITHGQPPTH